MNKFDAITGINSIWIDNAAYLDLYNLLKQFRAEIDGLEMLLWQIDTDRYDEDLEISDPEKRRAQIITELQRLRAKISYIEISLSSRFNLLTEQQIRDSYLRAQKYSKLNKTKTTDFSRLTDAFMDPDVRHPVIYEMLEDMPMMFISCKTYQFSFVALSDFNKNHCFDKESVRSLCGTATLSYPYLFQFDVIEDHPNNCKLCKHIYDKRRSA